MKAYHIKSKLFLDCIFNAIPDYPEMRDFANIDDNSDDAMDCVLKCERGMEKLFIARETIREMAAKETNEEVIKDAEDAMLLCDFLRGEVSLKKIDVLTNYKMFKEIFDFYDFSNDYILGHFFTISLVDLRKKYTRNLANTFKF